MRKRIEKKAWFEAPELGFSILIRYLPVPEMSKIRDEATSSRRDKRSGQMVDDLDLDIFAPQFAEAVILNWQEQGRPEGCISRDLYARMIPIDPEDYPEDIPCSQEFKVELLKEARWFYTFIMDMCTNLALIQKKQLAAEQKNS